MADESAVQPTRGPAARLAHSPATWALGLLLAAGGWSIGVNLASAVTAYPRAMTAAIVIFTVYAVPFLIFIANVDFLEPEPVPLLAAAFGWGCLVANAVAARGNDALESLLAKATSPAFAGRWGAALTAPLIEEPVKLLGFVLIVLIAREQINSIVDGIVYGAVIGLGFQVVEDILYAANAVAAESDGDRLQPVLNTLIARGFVSGLWSHTVFTALAGAGLAYAVLHPERPLRRRLAVAALGLSGAWFCHFAWNSPLLTDGLGQLAELTAKGIPPLVLALAVTNRVGHREADYYATWLSSLRDKRIATPAELAALGSRAGRSAIRRRQRRRAGWRWWRPWLARRALRVTRAARRLQRAQARLAVELSRATDVPPGVAGGPSGFATEPLPGYAVEAARTEVLAARERLVVASQGWCGGGPSFLVRVRRRRQRSGPVYRPDRGRRQ
jgi:RsiW-degrading membrane proteinase PrsW (M82 family)